MDINTIDQFSNQVHTPAADQPPSNSHSSDYNLNTLRVASLNSGSNGNCYYIGNETEAVLIDAGISCRETEQRMKRLELPISRVKAIFISHEHSDHISGVHGLSKKHRIPVYITARTQVSGRLTIREDLAFPFKAYAPVTIGNLTITAFPKFHDASDPHSFIISGNDVTIGVFTDIGRTCENLIKNFAQCHAAFLESNYDEKMLDTGGYPWVLKNRIRSGHGHLSNSEAGDLFSRHRPAFMSHVFLSHLSKNNNTPELAQAAFTKTKGRTAIITASRDRESEVYSISNTFFEERKPLYAEVKKKVMQLSIW